MIFDNSNVNLDFCFGQPVSLEANLTHGQLMVTSDFIDGVGEFSFTWEISGDYLPETWASEHPDIESCLAEAVSQSQLSAEYHSDLLSLLAWWRKRGRYLQPEEGS